MVGFTAVEFDEPMDAMLWFVELLITSTDAGFCPKPVLKNLIRRWYGEGVDSDFERCYGSLLQGGFIASHDWPQDRRVSIVELTDEGRLLLEQIKVQRHQDLELLRQVVQKLPRKDKKIVLRVFDNISQLTWRKMIEDGDPENSYGLYANGSTHPTPLPGKRSRNPGKKGRKSP